MYSASSSPIVPVVRPKTLGPEEGEGWWWPGGRVRFLATEDDTAGLFMAQIALLGPEAFQPARLHSFDEICLMMLAGGPLRVRAGGRHVELMPGDFLHIGKDTPYTIEMDSGVTARLLVLAAPGGYYEAWQRETGQELSEARLVAGAVPPHRRLRTVAAGYGISVDPSEAEATRHAPVTRFAGHDTSAGLHTLCTAGDTNENLTVARLNLTPGAETAIRAGRGVTGVFIARGSARLVGETDLIQGAFVLDHADRAFAFEGGPDGAEVVIWRGPPCAIEIQDD